MTVDLKEPAMMKLIETVIVNIIAPKLLGTNISNELMEVTINEIKKG